MSVWFHVALSQDNKGVILLVAGAGTACLQRAQMVVMSSDMTLTKTLRVAMVDKKILKIAMLQHLGSIDVCIRYMINLSGIN